MRPCPETPLENLVRTLLIPRLDQLEAEVKMLRELAWPVCQAHKEKGDPFSCIEEKRKYFRLLYKDEALDLLEKKARFTGLTIPVITHKELDLIQSPSQASPVPEKE
jgi:hypothetical protein